MRPKDTETQATRVKMRGWSKMEFASTRLSTVAQFRKMLAYANYLKEDEPCMFVFTLRFPPKTQAKKGDAERRA